MSLRREVALPGIATLLLLGGVGACTPNVEESTGADGGNSESYAAMAGRYSVLLSQEQGPYFLGDFILEEDGKGEFLPGWICNEDVRFPLIWSLGDADDAGMRYFEMDADDISGDISNVRLSGFVGKCFEHTLAAESNGQPGQARVLPNDGACLDELSNNNGMWEDMACLPADCGPLALSTVCQD